MGVDWFGGARDARDGGKEELFDHAGYPGDRYDMERMVVQEGVKAEAREPCRTGPVWTDADAAGGASGGPLWRNGTVFGVLSMGMGTEGVDWVVVFAGGERLMDLAWKARKEHPWAGWEVGLYFLRVAISDGTVAALFEWF